MFKTKMVHLKQPIQNLTHLPYELDMLEQDKVSVKFDLDKFVVESAKSLEPRFIYMEDGGAFQERNGDSVLLTNALGQPVAGFKCTSDADRLSIIEHAINLLDQLKQRSGMLLDYQCRSRGSFTCRWRQLVKI